MRQIDGDTEDDWDDIEQRQLNEIDRSVSLGMSSIFDIKSENTYLADQWVGLEEERQRLADTAWTQSALLRLVFNRFMIISMMLTGGTKNASFDHD